MSTELNLLPPERRRVLTRHLVWESVSRVLASLAIGLAVVTVAGGILGASLQALTWSAARGTQAEFSQALGRYKELRDAIASQNVVLAEMSQLSEARIVWSQLAPAVLAAFPPGVLVKTMAAETSTRKFSFGGVALARNTLIVLAERLRVLPWVEELKAPLSNLVQRDNPTFQFDLIIKKDMP